MLDTIVGRQILRSTRNLLIWNLVILLGVVAFFAITHRYWYNFFLGPFEIDREELLARKDNSELKNLVQIRGDACLDTGARQVSVKKRHGVEQSRRETAKFLAMFFDEKILIVKADMDASVAEVERRGVLDDIPDNVRRDIIAQAEADINRDRAQFNGRVPTFLPVMLDTTITRTKGYIALVILAPIGLICIANIFRAFSRFSNPQSHPTAKALMKYGEPEEVAQKIDEEYNSDDRLDIGPVTLTRSWLIHPTTFSVNAMFLGDAAWSYKVITQHYSNGVPTGKTYAANLCDIHGQQYTVVLKNEAQCDEFVVGVLDRVPWVLVGYDAELAALWKADKTKFAEIVDARRQRLAEEIRRQQEQPDDEDDSESNEPIDVEPA